MAYFYQQIEKTFLSDIDYRNYSIDAILKKIAAFRNKFLFIIPFLNDHAQFGYWITSDRADYVFFDNNTCTIHKHHIILHEISHILLGHKTYYLTDAAVSTSILMRNISRTDHEEQMAEELAIYMQNFIIHQIGIEALTIQSSSIQSWNKLISPLI